MTKRLESWERSLVRSSVMPSLKYSCLGSSLRFTNGSTTIEGLSGKGRGWELGGRDWGLGAGNERYWTATMTPTRSPSPRRIRFRTGGKRGGADGEGRRRGSADKGS